MVQEVEKSGDCKTQETKSSQRPSSGTKRSAASNKKVILYLLPNNNTIFFSPYWNLYERSMAILHPCPVDIRIDKI